MTAMGYRHDRQTLSSRALDRTVKSGLYPSARTALGDAAENTIDAVNIGGGMASAALIAAKVSWAPVVGPVVAGVALALALIFGRKGPKQKVATTKMVESVEPLLEENREGYLNGPRTAESQAAALKNFDDAWNWLTSQEACGSETMGNPGKACISDRARGGKFDWFRSYRDPIADAAPTQNVPLLGSDNRIQALLLPAGLALVALAL